MAEPTFLKIRFAGKDVGYAIVDEKNRKRITLLEFYLVPSRKQDAKLVLNEVVHSFHCSYWFVNSQDSFTLPLLLECDLSYELDGYLFSVEKLNDEDANLPFGISLDPATQDDLEITYKLIMQDGFFTGNGKKALGVRIKNGEIYLLRSEVQLIGVGFVCSLARTPHYSDIAMIIDDNHRMKGFGFQLVRKLIQISFEKGLIPTALTSPQNTASRKTLEKCGFRLDGCMLLAKII